MSGVRVKTLVASSLVCLLMTAQSYGLELKGNNYIGASFDSYHWGNDVANSVLDRTYGASFFGNYNAAPNLDLYLGYSGAWDSIKGTDIDVAMHTGSLGLNYLIMPEKSFTPYLGGAVGVVRSSARSSVGKVYETDPAFSAQLGGEWGMTDSTVLDVSLLYGYVDTEAPNNKGEYGMDISAGFTPIDDLVLFVSGKYLFEDETVGISFGAIIEI